MFRPRGEVLERGGRLNLLLRKRRGGWEGEVGVGEAVPRLRGGRLAQDGVAALDCQRCDEHGAVGNAGVELAVLAAGVDTRRQVIEQRRVEVVARSEEHTSELQSLMRSSYAVFCLKKKKKTENTITEPNT